MNISEREKTINTVDDFVEKAVFLSGNIIERYELDCGAVKSQEEAIKFAFNRATLGMEMEILDDYIRNIQISVDELRRAVLS